MLEFSECFGVRFMSPFLIFHPGVIWKKQFKVNQNWNPFLAFQDRWCLVQLEYRSRTVYPEGVFIIAGQTSALVAVDRYSVSWSIYTISFCVCVCVKTGLRLWWNSHGFCCLSHRFIWFLRRFGTRHRSARIKYSIDKWRGIIIVVCQSRKMSFESAFIATVIFLAFRWLTESLKQSPHYPKLMDLFQPQFDYVSVVWQWCCLLVW